MSSIDSFFALMRQSIIDSAPTGTLGIYREAQDNAKAEVDALRQRVEDLELMLREAGDGWLRRMGPSGKEPWERRWILSTSDGEIVMSPEEDGLPSLTPEAREELRKR